MALVYSEKAGRAWKFFRAGGTDQVRLDTADDLRSLGELDQKLWVALSCPTRGLEFDAKTLELLDADKDGRIRVPEILGALQWTDAYLKDLSELKKGSDTLPLSSIKDDTENGKALVAAAKQILVNLGKANAGAISVADTVDTATVFAQMKYNGDGIVPADSADDEAIKALLNDIIGCLGGETDRSGKPGVSQARVDQFYADLQAHADWRKKGENDAANLLPLGEATGAALDVVKGLKVKVDDYFTRCRLAAFDGRALHALNRPETEYLALASKDLSLAATEVAGFPLARIEAGKPLPLKEGVNPAWADALAKLQNQVIKPLLGDRASLTVEDWASVNERLAAHEGWIGSKAGAHVEKLGIPRILEILAGKGQDALAKLIAQDKALEPQANALSAIDRLVRYYRDLYQILNNFVSFADFYSQKRKAIFQAGTLYLDGRHCDLCVRVDDMGKHGALATLSKTYLAYCDCTRKGTMEKMTIAAAFTGGDSDQLMAGRNGVFYDRKGQDWDATITKILEHPISIRQAFWSPYKKFVKLIEDQIEKVAAAREKAAQDKAAAGVAAAAKTVEAGKPIVSQQAFDVGKTVGIFAAIGLALGALGTAAAAVLGAFMGMPMWQKPIALLALVLIISGPSVIIAWLKLRQRNLGPILDANGWAVNARVKINIPFGGALTGVAKLPPNSERALDDPYAEKSHAKTYLILAIVILLGACAGYFWWRANKAAKESDKPKVEAVAGAAATVGATNPAPAK